MHKDELFAMCCEATDPAVDRAIHDVRREDFHKRYIRGHCPLCTPVQNALERSGFKDRIKSILEGLD